MLYDSDLHTVLQVFHQDEWNLGNMNHVDHQWLCLCSTSIFCIDWLFDYDYSIMTLSFMDKREMSPL